MDSVTGEGRDKVDQANPDAESGPDALAGEMRRTKEDEEHLLQWWRVGIRKTSSRKALMDYSPM